MTMPWVIVPFNMMVMVLFDLKAYQQNVYMVYPSKYEILQHQIS